MPTNNDLLKASGLDGVQTPIPFTCYGELNISLWDSFQDIDLLIVGNRYYEFFPDNSIIMHKTSLIFLACLSKVRGPIISRKEPKYTDNVKAFVKSASLSIKE